MKVAKFGGSSVANSTQYKKIKAIIESDSTRNIIVVSAPGKDEVNSSKVTDLLFLLHAHLEYEINYDYILNSIYDRFHQLVKDLELSDRFDTEFELFKSNLKKGISKDYLVSRGEYFSALLLSEYLNYQFIDAIDIIRMSYDGTINYDKTASNMKKVLETNANIVVPGFYAATPNKMIRLFSRGGSDLTGSILARVSNAELYENWTDVSGIYTADPRIIDNPIRIANITYTELRELSYRGARVLQQESIIPLEQNDIPIQIKNTNDPTALGTLISNHIKEDDNIITGISGMNDYTSLNITKNTTTNVTKVLKDVFDLFLRYNLQIEHIPTGIDTFSIITKTEEIKKVYFDFMNDLRMIDGVISIDEEDEISLLAIVGRNMAKIPGVAGLLFQTLGKEKINIKVIAQASKEICIIIGVDNKNYKDAIKAIYKQFYKK